MSCPKLYIGDSFGNSPPPPPTLNNPAMLIVCDTTITIDAYVTVVAIVRNADAFDALNTQVSLYLAPPSRYIPTTSSNLIRTLTDDVPGKLSTKDGETKFRFSWRPKEAGLFRLVALASCPSSDPGCHTVPERPYTSERLCGIHYVYVA